MTETMKAVAIIGALIICVVIANKSDVTCVEHMTIDGKAECVLVEYNGELWSHH